MQASADVEVRFMSEVTTPRKAAANKKRQENRNVLETGDFGLVGEKCIAIALCIMAVFQDFTCFTRASFFQFYHLSVFSHTN